MPPHRLSRWWIPTLGLLGLLVGLWLLHFHYPFYRARSPHKVHARPGSLADTVRIR